ncbi:MAG TPA: cobyric acid synthase [Aestuariivirgaceae bacterium]|jgi:adenosylcobyric acid synthase
MLQGTGSDVGKSLIAAGLARAFANRGLKVRPFKPQNMSNNAAVTADGGEIGRAQALQAVAARVAPSVHMNPVLLKPESPTGAQLIVQGHLRTTLKAKDFMRMRRDYLADVMESFHRLSAEADLIIVEGAGSPAEINLRQGDIANMGFAEAAGIDVVLIGDVHRGGVIASVVGTFKVLPRKDAARLKAVIINNFHGDISLFAGGRKTIEKLTRRPVLGVIPHFAAARRLPAEDVLALEETVEQGSGGLKIAVLRLPRIANFDDLDPLRLEPNVTLHFVQAGEPIPADAKLVIIPGSKSTIADLTFLKIQGWDIDLKAHLRRGGHVLGLCGGYQMLGRAIHDPEGLEGPATTAEGLGLLNIDTTLASQKELALVDARHVASNTEITGYEIHLGRTAGPDCERPFAYIGGDADGARSIDGRVEGTYLHGCFSSDTFRSAYLQALREGSGGGISYISLVDETLNSLASHLEQHIVLGRLLELALPVRA